MSDPSHLTYEQRCTWGEINQYAHAWKEGEEAAIRGDPAKTCPYEVQAGFNTPRRRWCEGYIRAFALEKAYPLRKNDYIWCRKQLSAIPLDPINAVINRLASKMWRRIFGCAAIALVGTTTSTLAMQECKPGKEDARVRFCTYSANQVYHIWTAPGGQMQIQFAADETLNEGNVGATDHSRLELKARGNFLYLKNTAKESDTPCMVPEPLLVTSKLPNGTLRPYQFQFETIPNHCEDTPVAQQQTNPQFKETSNGLGIINAANAAPMEIPKIGNLKYIKEGGLGPNADVMYAVVFKYPGDEQAKREAIERKRQAEAEEQQNKLLMKQEVSWPYGNRFDGTWNYKYAGHGSGAAPAEIRDNGFHTVMLLPAMQQVPAFFSWMPGQQGCNREHDDHRETVVNPSSHTSGAPGDTIILPGTAQGWCLRGGGVGATATVYEIVNLAYSVYGQTPGTNTDSRFVRRVLKGGDEVDGNQ